MYIYIYKYTCIYMYICMYIGLYICSYMGGGQKRATAAPLRRPHESALGTTSRHRTVEHDPFIKSQLASRYLLQGLVQCILRHVTVGYPSQQNHRTVRLTELGCSSLQTKEQTKTGTNTQNKRQKKNAKNELTKTRTHSGRGAPKQ